MSLSDAQFNNLYVPSITHGITIFVPCYNEEINIFNTLVTIKDALSKIRLDYEILIFDDSSKDNSVKDINLFIARNQYIDISLIRIKINKGLGQNYIDGAFIGKYKFYMCILGGNSEPKETIKKGTWGGATDHDKDIPRYVEMYQAGKAEIGFLHAERIYARGN